MVFQSYALFPQMTVAANIGYGLRIRGVAPDRGRSAASASWSTWCAWPAWRTSAPAELSGGQRQRVALARAVAVRPRVLLLDEPLAALDAKLKESLRDELAELLRRLHITAVHVTHDQQEALAIADRLAVMRAGRIVQVGRGEDLYRAPSASLRGRVPGPGQPPRTRRRCHRPRRGPTRRHRPLPCPPARGMNHPTLLRAARRRPRSARRRPRAGAPPRVEHRTFLGDRVQLHLRLRDQPVLVADVGRDTPFRAGRRSGSSHPP